MRTAAPARLLLEAPVGNGFLTGPNLHTLARLPLALATGTLGFAAGTYYVYRSFSGAGRVPCA